MYGATIGKVAILAEPAVTNQAVCGCTPFSGVFNRYLFNFLVSQRTQFQSHERRRSPANISKGKDRGICIPPPALAEQHRIVAKVDELMALCDRLEAAQSERESRRDQLAAASLQRLNQPEELTHCASTPASTSATSRASPPAPSTFKQLRQTILNLAVRGRFVPQDPADESASELLKQIQADNDHAAKTNEGRTLKSSSIDSRMIHS